MKTVDEIIEETKKYESLRQSKKTYCDSEDIITLASNGIKPHKIILNKFDLGVFHHKIKYNGYTFISASEHRIYIEEESSPNNTINQFSHCF